jgi:hypothetical protein
MKNLRIKIAIVIVLGIVALFLIFQNRSDTLKKEISDFAIDDTTAVSKIYLADMQGQATLLTKEAPGKWALNDSLSARQESVDRLLASMFRMTVQSPVSRASYNNVITNMATSSVKVEVYKIKPRINLFNAIKLFPREKLTKVFYVGEPTSDFLGTYMLMEGSDTPFIVFLPGLRGYLSARFSANPNDWRDHTIFAKKPHEIQTIRVEFPGNTDESYVVEKYGRNELRLKSLSKEAYIPVFDTSRVINLINAYRNVRFENVVEKDAPINRDSIVSSLPLHIISVTDTAGRVQSMKTFRRENFGKIMYEASEPFEFDPDRLYGLINNEQEMVLIQYFVFDPITRPLSFFLEQ